MTVICPKCSHVRPPDASNPDWQCPQCGICYARFMARPPEAPRAAAAAVERTGPRLGWPLKVVLLVVLVLVFKVLVERRQAQQHENAPVIVMEQARPDGKAGVAFANAALQVSGVDAELLHSLSGRLERNCARNKYGLSESACIARFRAREDGCASRTAQRFPGQIKDTGRMQLLVNAYLGCIFEGD